MLSVALGDDGSWRELGWLQCSGRPQVLFAPARRVYSVQAAISIVKVRQKLEQVESPLYRNLNVALAAMLQCRKLSQPSQ